MLTDYYLQLSATMLNSVCVCATSIINVGLWLHDSDERYFELWSLRPVKTVHLPTSRGRGFC